MVIERDLPDEGPDDPEARGAPDEVGAEDDVEDGDADYRSWTCEVCGEANEVFVEPDAGALQELTEDCAVCCHPHTIRVRVARGGAVKLEVSADQ